MNNELTSKLDKYIEDCVKLFDLAGLIVGVGNVKTGYTYEGAAGVRNIETKELMKTNHVFHMASVSKLLTSMAIFMLIDEGKLNLEQKVLDFLTDSSIADRRCIPLSCEIDIEKIKNQVRNTGEVAKNPYEEEMSKAYIDDKRYKEVTIRHLLTHTSGLFEGKFVHNPDDKYFNYADTEYDLLGVVVEVASGIPYDKFINERILLPLGMSDSEMSITLRENLVTGHSKDSENRIITSEYFEYGLGRAPSSCLTSTVADMKKWSEEVLINKTLLSPESYEFALKEYVKTQDGRVMCMSWFKRTQNGYELYGHLGSDEGYKIGFWVCPELGVHLTVMSNITKTPINRICEEIFDMISQ